MCVCLCHQQWPETAWTGDFWSKSVPLILQNQEAIFLCKFGCSFCFLEFSLGFLGKENNFQRKKGLSCRTSLLCIVVTGDSWQVHVTHDTNIKEIPTKFGREVEIMLTILPAILPSHFTINIADSAIPTSPFNVVQNLTKLSPKF